MLGNDGVTGCEPWYSDGTPTGTGLLRDIRPGAEDSLLSGGDFVSVPERGLVFFDATDAYANYELWRTDGTRTGTEAVSNFAPMYAVGLPMPGNAGGTMFVSADDGVHGLELWKSDGTAEGTVLVKDIRPALANGNSDPAKMIQVGNRVFLQATDTTHGTELWLTDGLAGGAGTGLVKDIYAGNRSSLAWYRPSNARSRAAAMGSTLIFAASDNYTGSEIWKSDGTAAGTVQIKDIVPGSSGSDPDDLVGLD
jgi:ELWxxDGT repeat protein